MSAPSDLRHAGGVVMTSLPVGYRAAVIGASGAIGAAVARRLETDPRHGEIIRFGRSSGRRLDYADEESIAAAAKDLGEIHLLFIATGALQVEVADQKRRPEKALSQISPDAMNAAFAVNTIGPALVLKHFQNALPRENRSIIAALSARVGSIDDNRLGGWYGYRASKAALNQILRAASIEIARKRPETVVAALHPGTVESDLSQPFRPSGASAEGVFTPDASAARLLAVLDKLTSEQSGGFWDYAGEPIPW